MHSFKKITRCVTANTHSKTFLTKHRSSITSSKLEERSPWNQVVKEAERVVGYPTSFLSLRWILNDEIANVAVHIRKLVGTKHPLLKTAKSLLLRNQQPTWGLIVLLMSKVAGLNSNFSDLECDRTADILHSQRIIAEVTEMIKTSHLIHKGLINLDLSSNNISDLHFGNKLALLCGDYLLSTSFREVALLKNFQVQETISSTLRDLAESEFLGLRDQQNQPIPSRPNLEQKDITIPNKFGTNPFDIKPVLGNMKAEWVLRNVLSGGSLLGKSCQCALILANHESHVQELGYRFGRNLALAWQASLEKDLVKEEHFSLISAPVMLHLAYDPSIYVEIENVKNINYHTIREAVMSGPGLKRTSQLQEEFTEEALTVLEHFPNNDSKTALVNIITSLVNVNTQF